MSTFSLAKNELSLDTTINKLVEAYNKQDPEAYREDFSVALKESLLLEEVRAVLTTNMEKYGPIENFELETSLDDRRGLVFMYMERGRFDVHIRVNDSAKIERLTWYPHKVDPSEPVLTNEETSKFGIDCKPIVDSFVMAIADTNVELLKLLLADSENEELTADDLRAIFIQLNERGKFSKAGELEVTGPNEVLLPIYFDSIGFGFYLHIGPNKKISDVRITNYAPLESAGKSMADLGEDTLRTSDLRHFSQLEEAFKSDLGKVRLIALLSPT